MQKYANLVELEKMLSNAYFLAKFRFDTAENEPTKNLQSELVIRPVDPRTGASAPGRQRAALKKSTDWSALPGAPAQA